jgi:hypothetical protein
MMAERRTGHGEGTIDVEKAKDTLGQPDKEEEERHHGPATPVLIFCSAWKTKNLERARMI